jgi:UDP-N-acetylmuramate--alanine ligase
MKVLGKTRHIHFVGVGGIGMSGIAELLLNLGYAVSGSDIKVSPVTERLARLGGEISQGHDPGNVGGADVVVYSSAVPVDNPEIREAHNRNIPVIPRAEMLAELMRLKYGIAVAGAHGKTTTTSMIASILTAGNLDPTVVIGGRLDIWGGSNAKLGMGNILVAESDESDGSFMALAPTLAVVTNIDLEHIDHYGDMENIRKAFVDFINKIPFYGTAIICMDNEEIQNITPRLKRSYITYGTTSQADIRAGDIRKRESMVDFEVIKHGSSLGRVAVGMPGDHSVLNGLAAIAVGLVLDMHMDDIKKGLEKLGGLERRFQVKGEKEGIVVVDDYGHHPAEIVTTLKTAKECWPENRLVVVFQPHRYSRTRDLYDHFVTSFNQADILIIAPVYSAGEKRIEGVDSDWLCRGIREHGHKDVFLGKDHDDIVSLLSSTVKAGDTVITLGAGDIHRVADGFLAMPRKGRGRDTG